MSSLPSVLVDNNHIQIKSGGTGKTNADFQCGDLNRGQLCFVHERRKSKQRNQTQQPTPAYILNPE